MTDLVFDRLNTFNITNFKRVISNFPCRCSHKWLFVLFLLEFLLGFLIVISSGILEKLINALVTRRERSEETTKIYLKKQLNYVRKAPLSYNERVVCLATRQFSLPTNRSLPRNDWRALSRWVGMRSSGDSRTRYPRNIYMRLTWRPLEELLKLTLKFIINFGWLNIFPFVRFVCTQTLHTKRMLHKVSF